MPSRTSIIALFVAVGGLSAAALVHLVAQRDRCADRQLWSDEVRAGQSIARQSQPPRSYGKIAPPADVSISLVETDGTPGPVAILVSASSVIPVRSAVLTLRVPHIGAEPPREEVLSVQTGSGLLAQARSYVVDTLPVGQYHFVAVLEFLTQSEDAQEMAVATSLYVDVRPQAVLSSNVSFEHIKRLELRRELERRIVASLKGGLAIASEQAVADELTRLEAADPGIVDRRIAALAATDPDVARRIMELNEHQADTADDAPVSE